MSGWSYVIVVHEDERNFKLCVDKMMSLKGRPCVLHNYKDLFVHESMDEMKLVKKVVDYYDEIMGHPYSFLMYE